MLQLIISGLTNGSLYALVALGYVLIYKATSVLNFAQGEMVMLGGYLALISYTFLKLPYPVVFLFTIFMAALAGILIERLVYRPMIKSPIFTIIIATIALGSLLRSSVRVAVGDVVLAFPSFFSPVPLKIGSILISPQNFWIIVLTASFMVILYLYFGTRMGKAMRATQQKKHIAPLMGINVKKVFSLSWAISSALGGAAGVLMAPLLGVSPDMGTIAIKAFAAAILGGFTSMPGAIVGGFLLGIIENLAGAYISSAMKDITAFVVLILILMIKPTGLFETFLRRKV